MKYPLSDYLHIFMWVECKHSPCVTCDNAVVLNSIEFNNSINNVFTLLYKCELCIQCAADIPDNIQSNVLLTSYPTPTTIWCKKAQIVK